MSFAGYVQVEFQSTKADVNGNSWTVTLYGYRPEYENTDSLFSLSFDCTRTNSHFTPKAGLKAGETYYLDISASASWCDLSIPYRFQVKAIASASWEKEFNDSFETATPLSVSSGKTTTVYGASMWAQSRDTDHDYYRFVIPKAGTVTLTIRAMTKDLDNYGRWFVQLYDADGDFWSEVVCNNRDQLPVTGARIGLSAGTYYLEAGSLWMDSSLDDYQLDVYYQEAASWETERNDEYGKADPAVNDKTYSGSIMHEEDKDYYRVQIPETGRYQLVFKHGKVVSSSNMWILTLEDGNSTQVENWSVEESGSKTTKFTPVTLRRGTCYLIVEGSSRFGTSNEKYNWSLNRYIEKGSIKKVTNEDKGLKVTWKASADAAEYVLERKTGNGAWVKVATTKELSYLDTKASNNGTKYTYRLYGIAGTSFTYRGQNSAGKAMYRLTTPVLKQEKVSKQQIGVSWKKNSKATGYQLQIALNKTFTSGKKSFTIKNAKTVQKVIRNLQSKKTYYLRLRSYKNAVSYCSAWSKVLKIRTK